MENEIVAKLAEKLQDLPEFVESQVLVDLGLFKTLSRLYQARRRGFSPDFVKINAKILYPKVAVIEFIHKVYHRGAVANDK
jgi:hypothetical protein